MPRSGLRCASIARGSSMSAASRTARPANAIMQSPCTIRPGSPTCRANPSSRWIAKSSPEAAAYLTVWSSATAYVTSASGGFPSTSRRWSGARSPTPSSAVTPRKNSVTYCSFTSSPSLSRVSVLITSDVPFGRARSAIGVARETSVTPGSDGTMQHQVLLVVDDDSAGCRPALLTAMPARSSSRRARSRIQALRDVVGRLRVRLHGRLGDLVHDVLAGDADGGDVEAHAFRPRLALRHIIRIPLERWRDFRLPAITRRKEARWTSVAGTLKLMPLRRRCLNRYRREP